jgi:hypothetical protein
MYCGKMPPEVTLQVDHVVPICKGGPDDSHNLVTSCRDCNAGKSGVPLSEMPHGHQETVEDRREKLEQLKAITELSIELRDEEERIFGIISDRWVTLDGDDPEEYCIAGDRATAVRRFIKRLSVSEILEAVDLSFAKSLSEHQQFKYFCGICWRKIKGETD